MRGDAAKGLNPVLRGKYWSEIIQRERRDHLNHPLNNATPAECRAGGNCDRSTFYAPSWPLVQQRYAGAAGVGSPLCTLAEYYGEKTNSHIPPGDRDGYLMHPEIPHPVPLHPYTGWDYWPAGSLESMKKRELPGVVLDANNSLRSTRLHGSRPLHPGTGGELNVKMRRVHSLPAGELPTITVPNEEKKRHGPESARAEQPMTGRSSLRSFSARSQSRFGPTFGVGADLTRKVDRTLTRRGDVLTTDKKPAYRPGDTGRRDLIQPPRIL